MMINKIYVYIKRFIKENYLFLIALTIVILLNVVKLPYEVMMPGGTIDLTDRISVDGEAVDLKGSFNMAYVTVVQGSIPYVLLGSILPDWDVNKMSTEVYDKEVIEEENLSNRLDLIHSKNAAKTAAFNAAKIDYKEGEHFNYVSLILDEADTNLKVGDDINSVNGEELNDLNKMLDLIANSKEGDKLTFDITRDGKDMEAYAKVVKINGELKIGVAVLPTSDVVSDIDIEINTKDSESGPSGGMMMALMIYNAVTDQDLTNGKKVVGTGTIDKDGNVGEIGGIKYKVLGAEKRKADVFLVPEDNYEEAMEVKKGKDLNIEIVKIKTLSDAISYLEN